MPVSASTSTSPYNSAEDVEKTALERREEDRIRDTGVWHGKVRQRLPERSRRKKS
jgi:hypothetical protein